MVIDQQVEDDLRLLQSKRVYFGHQSVGASILEGVRDILAEYDGTQWQIVSLNNSTPLPDTYLAESLIGKNEFPDLKCSDFSRAVEERLGGNLDIALMKFCFADIMRDTDVDTLFESYKATIAGIKSRNPGLRIVHVTVPLTEGTSGVRRLVNNVLGRVGNNDMANRKRSEFNDILRRYYKDDPIFDLEVLESTRADGTRESFRHGGKTFYAIADEYSADGGGHLNETGRSVVAKVFLHTLANVAREQGSATTAPGG